MSKLESCSVSDDVKVAGDAFKGGIAVKDRHRGPRRVVHKGNAD